MIFRFHDSFVMCGCSTIPYIKGKYTPKTNIDSKLKMTLSNMAIFVYLCFHFGCETRVLLVVQRDLGEGTDFAFTTGLSTTSFSSALDSTSQTVPPVKTSETNTTPQLDA